MDTDLADLIARTIAVIRDRLPASHPARSALSSNVETARHGDPEIAIDDVSQALQYFDTPIRAEEFQALYAAAAHFSMVDSLEGIVIIPPDDALPPRF
ncbi:hypothetical protein [Streptomyces clavifer]|uniref:hypothetical protein n=1 Tax=Streptomyces clavifer TaxID=68188 RepID=UPI0033E6A55A